jgi:transposase
MRTRTFKLNDNAASALQVAYLNSQDGARRTRDQAVRLYGIGFAVAEILLMCSCSLRSLLEWCQRYRDEGLSGLIDHRAGGNRARLLALEVAELSQLLPGYTPGPLLGSDQSSGDGQHWTLADRQKLLAASPDQPRLLLWDRAQWHQGPALKAFLAAHPRLEIFFFPPASPDLNPQEHVWKATREAISHNHAESKLHRLADNFERHLSNTLFPCSLLEHHAYLDLCAMFK